MNNLDDFLKSKIKDINADSPSQWEALNAAIPVGRSGKVFAGWAFAVLLLSGLVTTALVLKYAAHTENGQVNTGVTKPSQNNTPVSTKANDESLTIPENPGLTSYNNSESNSTSLLPSTSPTTYEEQVIAPTAVTDNTVTEKGMTENHSPAAVTAEDKVNDKVENSKEENLNPDANPDVAHSPKSSKNAAVRPKTKSRSDFHKGNLYVSASMSIIGSYRSFQLNNGAAPFVHKQYDEIRQNSEQAIIGNGLSLNVEYRFLKNISVQGGVSYNKIGYQSNYNFEVTDMATTDNTGRITGYENLPNPIEISSSSKTKIGVLRIPFGINYNLLFNPNSLFHIYLGGSQNFILSADGVGLDQVSLQQKKIAKSDFVKNANELCVDIGVNFALASRYGIGIDLYYNKWVTDISKSKYENVTPFSGGINVSVSRKIF